MYVAIATDEQTGSVLGVVKKRCRTEKQAWRKARRLNGKRGDGVVREIITGSVKVDEKVGFYDPRLRDVWKVQKSVVKTKA